MCLPTVSRWPCRLRDPLLLAAPAVPIRGDAADDELADAADDAAEDDDTADPALLLRDEPKLRTENALRRGDDGGWVPPASSVIEVSSPSPPAPWMVGSTIDVSTEQLTSEISGSCGIRRNDDAECCFRSCLDRKNCAIRRDVPPFPCEDADGAPGSFFC